MNEDRTLDEVVEAHKQAKIELDKAVDALVEAQRAEWEAIRATEVASSNYGKAYQAAFEAYCAMAAWRGLDRG